MRVKTYAGPDLDSVLDRARRELGPDARVLDRRTLDGGGESSVEIRVAVDRSNPREADVRDELKRLSSQISRLQDPSVGTALDRHVGDDVDARTAPVTPTLQGARRRLVETGVSEDLAARFAKIAARDLPARRDLAGFERATEHGLQSLVQLRPLENRPQVLFLVGPPGVGKSTTAAKLAARQSGPVIWVDADERRVGAAEQAAIFSRHVGARLVRAASPTELQQVVRKAGKRTHIIVDTCGIGAADADRLAALRTLLVAVPQAQTVLLLPAGLHHREARTVVERFRPLEPTVAAFCKVDDAERVGELVTALEGLELPVCFATTGHTIPDDLEIATPAYLAQLLLKQPRAGHQEISK